MKERKKSLKLLVAMVVGITMFAVTGCHSSDPETEKALQGTWVGTSFEKEDGVTLKMVVTETFSLPDHRFESKVVCRATYPVSMKMFTATYSGTWSADKQTLYKKMDKNSVKFSFNSSVYSRSDELEAKREILEGFEESGYEESTRIMTPVTDTFEIEDDEGSRITYTRKS